MIIIRQRAFSGIEQKEFNSKAQKILRRSVDWGKGGPSFRRLEQRSITTSPTNVNESINIKAIHKDLSNGGNATKSPVVAGNSGLKYYKKIAKDKDKLISKYDHGNTDQEKRISSAKQVMSIHKHNK